MLNKLVEGHVANKWQHRIPPHILAPGLFPLRHSRCCSRCYFQLWAGLTGEMREDSPTCVLSRLRYSPVPDTLWGSCQSQAVSEGGQ